MCTFNKLYNLIIESIISQNKEFRQKVLAKAGCHQDFIDLTLFRLKEYDNKTGDLLAKFIAKDKDWQWSFPLDPRLDKVAKILKLNPSIDIQQQNGTMDQFISKYQQSLDNNDAKVAARTISQLDKIPQFSQKTEYNNGVVIYKVEESKAGMNAVRKIVDIQWGKNAKPWCLITRPMEQAWDFWCRYSEYPKHIAFQNGKLLAFCANDKHVYVWWDRKNQKYNNIPLEDGTTLKWKYNWSDPKEFVHYYYRKFDNILKYNEQTNKWDATGEITLYDEDLTDEGIPIPFGEVEKFVILDSRKLTSLKNAPTKVKSTFECNRCFSLRDIKDLPKEIGGQVIFKTCPLIPFERRAGLVYNKETGLWDANYRVYITDNEVKNGHLPYKFGKVKGYFSVYDCSKLFSLEGCPEEIPGSFDASCCHNLKSLVGGPKRVGGNFNIAACWELKNLQGAPEYIEGNFNCNDNHYLLSIEGGPKVVKGNINFSWCDELTSLKGCPDQIGGNVDCSNCHKLRDLADLPSKVKPNKDIITQYCYKLDAWAPYTGEKMEQS